MCRLPGCHPIETHHRNQIFCSIAFFTSPYLATRGPKVSYHLINENDDIPPNDAYVKCVPQFYSRVKFQGLAPIQRGRRPSPQGVSLPGRGRAELRRLRGMGVSMLALAHIKSLITFGAGRECSGVWAHCFPLLRSKVPRLRCLTNVKQTKKSY